jgi:hypothetical protein
MNFADFVKDQSHPRQANLEMSAFYRNRDVRFLLAAEAGYAIE